MEIAPNVRAFTSRRRDLPINWPGERAKLPMTKLSVTARGQVTFRKKVMDHLGIKPGGKIELELLPDGQGMIRAARPKGTIDRFIGLLAGKTTKVATIEEMNEAAARGWAGLSGTKPK